MNGREFPEKETHVYIKDIPKQLLILELWRYAKNVKYVPQLKLDLATIADDIQHMKNNSRAIDLTTYYGKTLFIDVSRDYVDCSTYNLYNGINLAQKIITNIKKEILKGFILNYNLSK